MFGRISGGSNKTKDKDNNSHKVESNYSGKNNCTVIDIKNINSYRTENHTNHDYPIGNHIDHASRGISDSRSTLSVKDSNITGINSPNTPNFCSLSNITNVKAFDSYVLKKHGAGLMGSNGRHDLHTSGNNLAMHEVLYRAQKAFESGWGGNGMMYVKAITLYDNNIKDYDIDYMRSVLCNFVLNLDALYLNRNQITDLGVTHLLSGLINAPTYRNIVELNLSENQISDKGVEMLSYYLTKGDIPKLKVLYLEGNNLSIDSNPKLIKLTQNIKQDIKILVYRISDITEGVKKQGNLFFGSKEDRQNILKGFIKQAQENGVDTKNVTVSKDIFDKIVNGYKLGFNFSYGYAKCNIVPESVKEFVGDQIIATASKKANIANKVIAMFTCYFETFDKSLSSQEGIQFIKDIRLVGNIELNDSIE